MSFKDELTVRIQQLEQRPDADRDPGLQRVIELLKKLNSQEDLNRQQNLINRIAIDSVADWDALRMIAAFMKAHTEK
jgi:hypothetical protein